jgi:hypothetical protein
MPRKMMSLKNVSSIVSDNFGKTLASYFSSPIEDRETLEFLQSRARIFSSNGQNFSSSILQSFAVDFGGLYLRLSEWKSSAHGS